MIALRLRQIALLLASFLLCGMAFYQMFTRTEGAMPQSFVTLLTICGVLSLIFWALVNHFQPYASQVLQPCVVMLTGIGAVMIARIDHEKGTAVAQRQLEFVCIAIVLCSLLVVFLRDYRLLRRFSYVSMVIGLVLLLSPMLPVLG